MKSSVNRLIPQVALLGCLSIGQMAQAAGNVAPKANAGPDIVANKGAAVTLAGSGSDQDGRIAAYQWVQTSGPSVVLSGANKATASFTAPVLSAQAKLGFRLTVTDNKGAKGTDSAIVTVIPNAKPTANAGPDQSVKAAVKVALTGTGSDPDGTVASYLWTQTAGPTVTLSGANLASASFVAPTVTAATKLTFRLTVNDNNGATASDDMVVTVNTAPTAAAAQWVMGYYVSYQRDLYPPEQIDWNGLTHIVMSRVTANADGTLNTDFDWDATNGPALAKDLSTRAHAAGRKAILMLGGADNGANILSAVTSHRAAFIANLRSAMTTYGYDGLDLDWEDNVDWALFQTLAQELRQAMPNAVLTAPIGPLNINYDVVEPHLPAIAQYLDRLNMMSYYPATSWTGSGWQSWYNSPLSGVKPETPVAIDDSLQRYAAAGIAKAKLGMGMGFYYTCYTGGITGPNQSTENGVTISAGDNDAPLSELFGANGAYSELARHWDALAQEPYLSLPQPERHGCRYVSFEDEQSILAKGKFSRDNGYGGTIIWTINQGYVKTHSEPNFLVEALRQGFLEPAVAEPVGISVMQGDTWLKTGAQEQFSALITGSTDKAVTWTVVESDCGSIDAQGLFTAPGAEGSCTVKAMSLADPSKVATSKVTVANAAWTPGFSISRAGTWWVEIVAEDATVASMSVQMSDGTLLPLTVWDRQWGTDYPVFVANYGFPDAGGIYTFYARSANNRSATTQLMVPACVHGGDGVCQ